MTKKEEHAKKMNGSEARHLLQILGGMKDLNFTDGIFLNESCVDIFHTGRPATSHRRNNRGN